MKNAYETADEVIEAALPALGDDSETVSMAREEVQYGEPGVAIEIILGSRAARRITYSARLISDVRELLGDDADSRELLNDLKINRDSAA